MDPPWDDREDLVEIAKSEFEEADGPANGTMRSNACQSTAIYRRRSLVRLRRHRRFLFSDFSKLPIQTGIPCGNVGFLTLLGVQRGGLCCKKDFEKALAEIQLEKSHD